MKLTIPKKDQNLLVIMRQISYRPDRRVQAEESSFSRPVMGRPYPRFHIYIAASDGGEPRPEESGREESGYWVFKLHLDQKKPSYSGSAAHSGEYEGPTVETEAERIKQILNPDFAPD